MVSYMLKGDRVGYIERWRRCRCFLASVIQRRVPFMMMHPSTNDDRSFHKEVESSTFHHALYSTHHTHHFFLFASTVHCTTGGTEQRN